MTRRASITREQIVDAALALVRDEGHERLNARALAARLGCSTQPILYHFASMDEVRQEVYRAADELHSQVLMRGIESDPNPLLALGRNYVRFAYEEPRLFRFLFQTGEFDGRSLPSLVDMPEVGPLVELVGAESGLAETAARTAFLSLFAAAHGLASLLANNAMPYDEALAEHVLLSSFQGALSQKGVIDGFAG